MIGITAPTDFARIMQNNDCAKREVGGESRPDYSNKSYIGKPVSYSANGSYADNRRINY